MMIKNSIVFLLCVLFNQVMFGQNLEEVIDLEKARKVEAAFNAYTKLPMSNDDQYHAVGLRINRAYAAKKTQEGDTLGMFYVFCKSVDASKRLSYSPNTAMSAYGSDELDAIFSYFLDKGTQRYNNKELQFALWFFDLALKANSSDVTTLIFAGFSASELHDYRRAIQYFEKARLLGANEKEVILALAENYGAMDDFENASMYLSMINAQELDNDLLEQYNETKLLTTLPKIQALIKHGNLTEAERLYVDILDVEDDIDLIQGYAKLLRSNNKKDKANEFIRTKYLHSSSYSKRVLLMEDRLIYDFSSVNLSEIEELMSLNDAKETYYLLGLWHYQNKKYQEAQKYLQIAIDNNPSEAKFLKFMGFSLYQQAELEQNEDEYLRLMNKTVPYLERSLELNTSQETVRELLISIYEAAGLTDEVKRLKGA